VAAARETGIKRFVAQSFAPYRCARQGGMVKAEDDPLDPSPPAGAQETNAAMAYLDRTVTEFGGIALRYCGYYGNADDQLIRMVRKRRHPMIGSGNGATSWIHLADAAAATVLALEHDGRPSTTSSMTSPRRRATGSRYSRALSGRSRPGTSRLGWSGSSPERMP